MSRCLKRIRTIAAGGHTKDLKKKSIKKKKTHYTVKVGGWALAQDNTRYVSRIPDSHSAWGQFETCAAPVLKTATSECETVSAYLRTCASGKVSPKNRSTWVLNQ